MLSGLTAAVIHYRTPGLLESAVESFRMFYPEVPLWIVDNGSGDESTGRARELADAQGPDTRAVLLESNIFHGPAMDLVLRDAPSDRVFFLDSDTVTRRGGFLEPMAKAISTDDSVLASGHIVTVDRRGFAADQGIPVPASAYMMIDRSLYLTLPPFVHHGLPVLHTCREARRRGLRMARFPVEEYVDHLGRGTADRYGYGLGLRSRLDYLLHRLGL